MTIYNDYDSDQAVTARELALIVARLIYRLNDRLTYDLWDVRLEDVAQVCETMEQVRAILRLPYWRHTERSVRYLGILLDKTAPGKVWLQQEDIIACAYFAVYLADAQVDRARHDWRRYDVHLRLRKQVQ